MAQKRSTTRGGRGSTRKPVTIDLEATPVEPETNSDPVVSADEHMPDAEPVALDQTAETLGATVIESETAEPEIEAESVVSDDANAQEAPKVAAAAPSARRSGGLGALGGGLIGGIVALAGAAGLQFAGVIPQMGQQQSIDVTPLEAQIADLKSELSNLASSSGSATLPADAEERLGAALAANETLSADLASVRAELADARGAVDDLQQALSAGAAGDGAAASALSGRLDTLESTFGDLSGQISALSAAGDAGVVDAAVSAAVEPLKSTITAVSEEVASVKSGLTELGLKVGALETSVAEGGNDSAAIARAIAAAGLNSAIERGIPFMGELEAYATVAEGANAETIETLRNYAASGVPTISQLADEFGAVANRIVSTGQGVDENASITDKLMASARSLVQVRPVGEVEGDTPGAIAARMEVALRSGNLDEALAQWATLPDAAKAVSAEFEAKMRARQSVNALTDAVLADAMAGAGKVN